MKLCWCVRVEYAKGEVDDWKCLTARFNVGEGNHDLVHAPSCCIFDTDNCACCSILQLRCSVLTIRMPVSSIIPFRYSSSQPLQYVITRSSQIVNQEGIDQRPSPVTKCRPIPPVHPATLSSLAQHAPKSFLPSSRKALQPSLADDPSTSRWSSVTNKLPSSL